MEKRGERELYHRIATDIYLWLDREKITNGMRWNFDDVKIEEENFL